MKLGAFLSEHKDIELLERLKPQGVFLVQNGVYCRKHFGEKCYCLIEDLETRGLSREELPFYVEPINYDSLVDIITSDYDKLIWL